MPKLENTIESMGSLMDLMTQKGVSKLSYSCEEFEIKLETPSAQAVCVPAQSQQAITVTQNTVAPKSEEIKKGNIVKSPIVGTYYSSPAPDKPPFVTIGKKVKKGDVIMIIESMKLMNEIQSDYDGTVAEIMIENGSGVEFDQPIMRIE